MRRSPSPFRILLKLIPGALLLLACSPAVFATQDNEEKRRAFQLFQDAKYVEALPLFEKLAAAHPDDPEIIETFGLLVITQTAYLKDPDERRQARVRGREILVRAEQLGASSTLLKWMLSKVPPDGGDDTGFSPRKEVDDAMREGEGAFASGDFPKALEMYHRALLLDPKLYEAALFIGDVYYKSADQKKAGEWFARAVAIDPDRETAYRYWGDSLMKQARVTEAGDKFIEAYIAEPYSRLARTGFINWGNKVHINLGHPRVEIPTSVNQKQGGGATVLLDSNIMKNENKTGSAGAWMLYGLIRAGWQSQFAKNYPNEKTYRHSLKEEAAAIRAALRSLEKQKPDAEVDPSLKTLQKLEKEGFLEAFILLAMPDEGIAQDYTEYKRDNIETLRRYVKQYVLNAQN